MSYCAECSGYIDFLTTENNYADVSDGVKVILREVFDDVFIPTLLPLSVEIYSYSNYHEEDVKSAICEINNKYRIASGEIEFRGEDNALWRFIYKNGDWYEENGWISYEGSPSTMVKGRDAIG